MNSFLVSAKRHLHLSRQAVDWNAALPLIESLHAKRITRQQPDTKSTHLLPQWTLLGCGALGGVFASLLTQSGQATRVLLRERHRSTLHPGIDFTSLEGHTQLINIERGFISQPGQHQTAAGDDQGGQVIEALTPLVGQLATDVPIVLLHNGMGIAEQVVTLFPHNPVIAGVTSHGAMQSGHFVFRHTGKGETWLGPVNEAARAHAALADDLAAPSVRPAGMSRSRRASGRTRGQLRHQSAHRALQAQEWRAGRPALCRCPAAICVEVADVMRAEGQPTGSEELLRRVMMVVELTADNYSSMYQDMEQGRETEIEAITGFLLGKAALHGIAVPVNQGLYQAVKEKH
jgi:2-dehydropantoate 2-reductase